jgi:uncharacterized membrane protein
VIAGTGTSFCFPTVANAIIGSVSQSQAGIAAGTNSALRELGGVFGVAVLASVFARPGVYSSHAAFIAGFTNALWVAVAFSVLGVLAALLSAPSASASSAGDPRLAHAAAEGGAA